MICEECGKPIAEKYPFDPALFCANMQHASEKPGARDTQFAGFAKMLWEEVARNVSRHRDFLLDAKALRQEEEQIIARRAYDLVEYALSTVSPLDLDRLVIAEQVERTADLTAWPKERPIIPFDPHVKRFQVILVVYGTPTHVQGTPLISREAAEQIAKRAPGKVINNTTGLWQAKQWRVISAHLEDGEHGVGRVIAECEPVPLDVDDPQRVTWDDLGELTDRNR